MYLIFFVLLMERMLQNLPYFIYKKRYAVFFFNLSNFEFYLINPQVCVDIYMGFLINKIWPILMCFSRRLNWGKILLFLLTISGNFPVIFLNLSFSFLIASPFNHKLSWNISMALKLGVLNLNFDYIDHISEPSLESI